MKKKPDYPTVEVKQFMKLKTLVDHHQEILKFKKDLMGVAMDFINKNMRYS